MNWTDSEGDILQLNQEAFDPSSSLRFPEVGDYPPASLFEVICASFVNTCGDMMGDREQPPVSGSVTVTEATVPEPGMELMLVCGVVLVGMLKFREKLLA